LPEEVIEELGEVIVLMIPVGGTFTLGSGEAVEVVRNIEPNFILPMHFQEAGLNQTEFSKLESVDEFLKESGMTVEKLPKLSVKDVDIGEDSRIILLEKR